ncbi:MAG: FtsX-like permease family protein [Acidobacteria bacterium]|nr:FtsX-like permease family protein [Acidobacteriota bacterium]
MSYMVARRRNEIGVRLALGAGADHVLKLVLFEAARLVVVGLVVGLAVAWWSGRYAESLVYGLQVHDVRTLAIGCALLACTGALASLAPALRALRVQPATVLRSE